MSASDVVKSQKVDPCKLPLQMPKGPTFVWQDAVTLVLVLPPPHPALNAHNKGHWSKKTKLVKSLRWWTKRVVEKAQESLTRKRKWDAATINYLFFFPDDIQRDSANAVQALKPAIDGIVDSGLIPDDDWKHLFQSSVYCAVDRVNPRTVIVLRRAIDIPADPENANHRVRLAAVYKTLGVNPI